MYTGDLLLSGPPGDLAATGFLGATAFAVTIMLAAFAVEFVAGVVTSTLRLFRKALTVAILCAVAAGAAGVLIVAAHGR